jgi:hypothetical protein
VAPPLSALAAAPPLPALLPALLAPRAPRAPLPAVQPAPLATAAELVAAAKLAAAAAELEAFVARARALLHFAARQGAATLSHEAISSAIPPRARPAGWKDGDIRPLLEASGFSTLVINGQPCIEVASGIDVSLYAPLYAPAPAAPTAAPSLLAAPMPPSLAAFKAQISGLIHDAARPTDSLGAIREAMHLEARPTDLPSFRALAEEAADYAVTEVVDGRSAVDILASAAVHGAAGAPAAAEAAAGAAGPAGTTSARAAAARAHADLPTIESFAARVREFLRDAAANGATFCQQGAIGSAILPAERPPGFTLRELLNAAGFPH